MPTTRQVICGDADWTVSELGTGGEDVSMREAKAHHAASSNGKNASKVSQQAACAQRALVPETLVVSDGLQIRRHTGEIPICLG